MRTYKDIEALMRNRMCFELASDSCVLQAGNTYIQTFCGRPLVTFYRDRPSIVSVANPGVRWMRLVGARIGVIKTRAAKRRYVEPYRRVYFSGISFSDTKQNLEVETNARGEVTNISVPKEDTPRTYMLNKQRWAEYLAKVEDLCTVSIAKSRLSGNKGSYWAPYTFQELLNIDQKIVDRFMGYEARLKTIIRNRAFCIQEALDMLTFEV